MSEKLLLLSSARSGVLVVSPKQPSHWWRKGAILLGIVAILVGGIDVASRLSHISLSPNASFLAFAPAALIGDPALTNNFAASNEPTVSQQVAGPFTPIHLRVPSLNINAPVENVGNKKDGSMGTPTRWENVAWYKLGSKPGAAGNAVFAGHVNNALTTSGVFSHLSRIKTGAQVIVSDDSGNALSYTVSRIDEYEPNTAPNDAIFATDGPSQIVLITCDGDWDATTHSFSKRLVVVARLMAL